MPLHQQQRAQHKTRRILRLIKHMMDHPQWQTVNEIASQFSDQACSRSIRRDLDLLLAMNIVDLSNSAGPDRYRIRHAWSYSLTPKA